MAYEYHWEFPLLEWQDKGELARVITVAHWRVRVSNSDTGNSAEVYGSEPMNAPNPDRFTAWEDVTPEMVKTFLGDAFVIEKQGAALEKLNPLDNPPATQGKGVPWGGGL